MADGKPGRPKADVDPDLVEGLAKLGCTVKEIATLVGCSKDVLERRFQGEMKRGRQTLSMSIRRALVAKLDVSDRVLIHCADRYLGVVGEEPDKNDAVYDLLAKRLEAMHGGNGQGQFPIGGLRKSNGVPPRFDD